MLLINKINDNGPSMKPCRTTQVIQAASGVKVISKYSDCVETNS